MSPSLPAPLSNQAEPLHLESVPPAILAPVHMPGGLVPADQLPSAADVLAELFPSEENAGPKKGKSLSSSSSASMILEENSFPYAVAPVAPLPSFDPYSLSVNLEAPLVEGAARVLSPASSPTDETDPELHSLEIGNADRQEAVAESVAPIRETIEAEANAADAAPGDVDISTQPRRKRGGKTSLRRLATGIRRLLKNKNRSMKPQQVVGRETQAPESMAAPTPSSSLEPATDFEGTEISTVQADVTPESLTGETPAAGDLAQQHAPEVSEPDSSSGAIDAPGESLNTDPVRGAEVSFLTDEQPAEDRAHASPVSEAPLPHADFEASEAAPEPHDVFFNQESSQESSQEVTADEQFDDVSAEEDVDSSDDDHAIATAIERYANTTAAVAAEAERIANAGMPRADLSPNASAVPPEPENHVDINSVLGIPRDPEPAQAMLASGQLFIPGVAEPALAEAEAFVVSGSTIPAPATDSLAADASVADAGSPAVPENSSTSRPATIPYRDWSFEEKIASHHEWIESKGATGKKADLTASDLEGSDLIGVDLRFVDLHDANLRAADLLMADLRDACLVRANFRDSCLVGANLEAANLESASLETAMGLVPRQLAGANLHEATLPAALEFEALPEFKRTARQVHRYFVALLSMCALSALLVWMTKDFQLLTNSAVLFFLHSSAAAAALPTVQFYLIAPMALSIVYLVLQFHLQHLWDLALELPAVFPDGRTLGENEPRIVLGLLRAHFRWMNADAPSTRFVEKGLSLLLAYWIVPLTLLFYWARFLTLQQLRGTTLHSLLIASAVGVALYSSTKVGKPAERWIQQENPIERIGGKLRGLNPVTPPLVLLGILMYLAIGTMMGVPHSKERAPQFMSGSVRRWAPSVLWTFGIDPYADLTEATISKKPDNWNGSDEQVGSVDGARLNGANFRYAQAYRAFLANAHLLHANLQGAFLSQADLRSAEMGQSNLKYAVLDQAQMNHVNLDRATLTGANLSRADLRNANLSYAAMGGAALVDAHLDSATLYGARLNQATLIRTNFEKADLRESHLEGANLEHVDMQGAYLWSAKLMGASLTNADLQKAILVDADLHGADLRWAHLDGTVLTGADLTGAYLDGADLRSAVGFGANQICAAKSRHGLLLDDAMQMQVGAQCGAGN